MYVVIRRDDTGDFVDVLATRSDRGQGLQVAAQYAEKLAAEYDGATVEPLPDTPGFAIADDTCQLESIEVIECKDTGMQSFHAYEIATDSGYHVGVSEKDCTDSLARFQEFLAGRIETVALGTVEAENLESAIDKVRAGDWSYSQRC